MYIYNKYKPLFIYTLSSLLLSLSPYKNSVSAAATPSSSSMVAWSSSYSASYVMPTAISSSGMLPRPSGSIIPPVTTSSSITPSNSGSLVMADLGKILISVTVAAVLGNFLN
jgi:hypothetical protein